MELAVGGKKYGVNVRCVEGLDLDKLTIKDMDGKSRVSKAKE